jgi:hypothetical protein
MFILAHMCAVFSAWVIILTGSEMLLEGMEGFSSGLGKSIGGLLIWFFLALVSLPLGGALRYLAGRLPVRPLSGAIGVGVAVGWALIPVLNPAMSPSLTFASHPVGLLVVYSLAGIVGGTVWWAIEFQGVNENHVKI